MLSFCHSWLGDMVAQKPHVANRRQSTGYRLYGWIEDGLYRQTSGSTYSKFGINRKRQGVVGFADV